jgi:ribosomal protein S18 acetylase RimI-like enzyme
MPVEIISLTPADLRPLREQFLAITRNAFAVPPYNESEMGVRAIVAAMERHSLLDGFRCLIAQEHSGGPILGFGYGFTGQPGLWWRDVVAREMTSAQIGFWLTDYFELTELAVLSRARGRGIGSLLHDTLLAGLPRRRAMSSTGARPRHAPLPQARLADR